MRCCKPAKFFADSTSLGLLSLPAHDEALADDTLYTIRFNHEWREIVASALQFYFKHYRSELGYDNEDLLSSAILDLYNAETFVNRKFKTANIDLVSNKTTTSLTGVAVAGTDVVWTPTYPNWRITFFNIDLVNSTAGEEVNVSVEVVGQTPAVAAVAHTQGTTRRVVQAIATYLNKAVGASRTARLVWNVTGGTATMSLGSFLGYEIEEWD